MEVNVDFPEKDITFDVGMTGTYVEIGTDLENTGEDMPVSFAQSGYESDASFEDETAPFPVEFKEVQQVEVPGQGGTTDHAKLKNRGAADQHPMSAITGLEKALGEKQPAGVYLTKENDPTVPAWAKQPHKPGYTASEVGADPSGAAATALKTAQEYADKQIAAKLDASVLTEAVNAALAQAKESGEFDGKDGDDGGFYSPDIDMYGTDTMLVSFTGSKDGMGVRNFRIALPKAEAPVKGTDYWTEADRQEIVAHVLGAINGGVPNDYEILEYIESHGNEFINVGYIPNKDTRVDMIAMSMTDAETSYNDGTVLYGSGVGYNNNAFECYGSKGQYEFNYFNQNPYLGTLQQGEIVRISHNKNFVTLYTPTDGKLTMELEYGDFTVPHTMYLFAINRGSVSFKGKVRIYSCQIYDTGLLIRSFVPVKRKQDGVLGMYCTVNRTFFTNEGTGAFTVS